ncbi:MAG: hypothetical protein AB8G86_22200 [Saprospiraceae bacterium]
MWNKKGESFSDKNARKEYSITQEEIIEGIQQGKLQYRVNYIHGNPYYKLLRQEVENLMIEKHGSAYLERQKLEANLAKVTTEIRSLKRKIKKLEREKSTIEEQLKN